MRAALYRRFGPAADVLEVLDLDVPAPGPGEVRVRITTSGINPTDWKTRAGRTARAIDGFQIPHHDGTGIVDELGSGVGGVAVGQRVWLHLAAIENRFGTAAEYSVVPAGRVAPLPAHASDALGACLGVPALTAAHCLGGDPAALGDTTVLVAGGAGAVGHYAIQLAAYAGATVVATVSSPEKADLAARAGAGHVVDYTEPGAADRIREAVGSVDRIVEVAIGANLELNMAVLGTGGTIASYAAAGELTLPVGDLMRRSATVAFVLLYALSARELAAAVAWTSEALDAGALTELPIVTYPLEAVADAQDRVADGVVGKVVLRMAGT